MTDTRTLKPFPYTPPPQLVGDIGGTNTRLALADSGVLRPGSIRRFQNAGQDSFQAIVAGYMRDCAVSECAGVCLAVAGPVRDGVVQMTNLDWQISHEALCALTGSAQVMFLNDLQAQGYVLDALDPGHIRALARGAPPPPDATRLVVGIGTGFNAAVVHRVGQVLHVPPSEFGHTHLPQHDATARALGAWLGERHPVATVEEALSGRGLVALHRFLGGDDTTPEALVSAISAGEDAARATGALYAQLLGRVLANLALIHLPYGGIWLIGGTARAIGPHLMDLGLEQPFRAMGRYAHLAPDFALHLIEDDYAALTGCAAWLNTVRD